MRSRRIFGMLLTGGLVVTAAVQGQPAEQCKPYRPTVSSGWYFTTEVWDETPEAVCRNVLSRSRNPWTTSEGWTVTTSLRGVLPSGPGGWLCNFHYAVSSEGNPLPEQSGERGWDGVTGPHCALKRISLEGPSRTKALPAGPVLPQKATVTSSGSPAAGAAVQISIGGSSVAGSTDAAGEFHFTYVPPRQKAVIDSITATCTGCENSAQKQIQVEACDICE